MIDKLLEYVIKNKASDLHLSCGSFPTVRIDGLLVKIPGVNVKLTDKILLGIFDIIMSDNQKDTYHKTFEVDFSIKSNDGNRFRVNAFRNIEGASAVFRLIPARIMTFADLMMPSVVRNLCKLSKGLVLVVGPTGSGKSTTLASIIENINTIYSRHIITIEDPIEFLFKSNKSLINQREVGSSTHSFASALRSALREDPDVIMVGELRDLETTSLALTAAETGHLVFGTMHTNSAAKCVDRIVDIFPVDGKHLIRSMLSSSLQAVIYQKLLPKKGGGRCAAFEVLIANNPIKNLIRENKIPQIASMMEIGKKYGMITIRDSILDLAFQEHITRETAEDALISIGEHNTKVDS